jgi:hypothetical protein
MQMKKKRQPRKIDETENRAESFRQSLIRVESGLKSLYGRLPVLPFLDRETSAMLIIALAAYLAFTLWVVLSSPLSSHPVFSEAPLAKNALLALRPGESYSYQLSAPGNSQQLGYRTFLSPSCGGIEVEELGVQPGQQVCLTPSGNIEGDWLQLNSSLGNSSILLFAPWMLAVSDSFTWQVNAAISTGAADLQVPITFRSHGSRTVAGRPA